MRINRPSTQILLTSGYLPEMTDHRQSINDCFLSKRFDHSSWLDGSADGRHFGQIAGGQQNLRRRAVDPPSNQQSRTRSCQGAHVTDDKIDCGVLNQPLGFGRREMPRDIVASSAMSARDVRTLMSSSTTRMVSVPLAISAVSVGRRGRRGNLREVDAHGGCLWRAQLSTVCDRRSGQQFHSK